MPAFYIVRPGKKFVKFSGRCGQKNLNMLRKEQKVTGEISCANAVDVHRGTAIVSAESKWFSLITSYSHQADANEIFYRVNGSAHKKSPAGAGLEL